MNGNTYSLTPTRKTQTLKNPNIEFQSTVKTLPDRSLKLPRKHDHTQQLCPPVGRGSEPKNV